MLKRMLAAVAFVLTSAAAGPALAILDSEPFLSQAGYTAGDPLSAVYWDQNPGSPAPPVDTTGVLDLEDVGGGHGLVVKLSADGPDTGPAFPSISAATQDWSGPGRSDGQLWFTVDVQKGSGDANTSMTDFIWNLSFIRQNGLNNILSLEGGLGTFRLRSLKAGPTSGPIETSVFDLHDGWNQLGVLNDNTATPNTILYLDGVQVATLNAENGPLLSNSTSVYRVTLEREAGGGAGHNFVGSMRFDNIITADERIIFPPGDANFDGTVDIFDVNLVSAHWGETWDPLHTPPAGPGPDLADANGDANHDGVVNIFDINLISANWTPSGGNTTAVPEPATWLLLSCGAAGLLARRSRFKGASF
jgi:Dockerin type I domain/PEP-CTERM motif